jgi:SAM-dependent methyltransferase
MSAIAASVQKFAKPFHVRLRASRCSLAATIMRPNSMLSLIDVGGSPGFGGEFNQMRSRFGRVTVVNLDARTNRNLIAPNVTVETADGCNLPYEDKSFDWAFSNAVLEHVGDFEKQSRFAAEIQRVARVGYFISTPNRAFLLDSHTYLPYYHRLPPSAQRIAVHLSLGLMKHWEPLNLVTAEQLQRLFPRARVEKVGPFGLNLVAYGS